MMMISGKASAGAFSFVFVAAALMEQPCLSFQLPTNSFATIRRCGTSVLSSAEDPEVTLDPEAVQLKDDLVALASTTRRGVSFARYLCLFNIYRTVPDINIAYLPVFYPKFSASRTDRDKAKKIINKLSKYSPTDEPAAAYYTDGDGSSNARSTLTGKWTLIYTDAPGITSLDGGPFSTAKLGRIGQECDPPTIKNVIEWQRPDWASSLPFSGGESSRVLQKVVTEGSATPDNPKMVDLKLLGLELTGVDESDESGQEGGLNALLNGPAALFQNNPVKLQGPLKGPFGRFNILYLDHDMRITKTYQGYLAVNVREENAWF